LTGTWSFGISGVVEVSDIDVVELSEIDVRDRSEFAVVEPGDASFKELAANVPVDTGLMGVTDEASLASQNGKKLSTIVRT
jgi:hypothetical protein